MTDFKLGKKPPVEDKHDLKLMDFVDKKALPKRPTYFGHENSLAYSMCGNGPDDTVYPGFGGAGDCVLAAADHETQIWLNEAGVPNPRTLFNGKTAIADYSAVTGYVVGDDSTDQGTVVRDALKYRQKTGIVDTQGKRHKIGAYLALDPGNTDHIYTAMYLFGAVEIGFQVPDTIWSQTGKIWKPVPGAQIIGGHDVPLVAKRSTGIRCVTWGSLQFMSVSFYKTYCDEAWAIISPESLKKTGRTAEGLNIDDLNAAIASL